MVSELGKVLWVYFLTNETMRIKKVRYSTTLAQSKRLGALISLLGGKTINEDSIESLRALNLIEEKEGKVSINSAGKKEAERLLSFVGISVSLEINE